MSYEEERGEQTQDDNDYELLPHEELEKLRREVEAVKRNPLGKYHDSEDLIGSMNQLTDAINKLLKLFSSVKTSMIEDFTKHSLHDHFSQISSQNEKIAQGIVAVAKMVKNQNQGAGQNMDPAMQGATQQGAGNGMQGSASQGVGQFSAQQGAGNSVPGSGNGSPGTGMPPPPGQNQGSAPQSSSRPYPQGVNAQGMPQPGMGNQQQSAPQGQNMGSAPQASGNGAPGTGMPPPPGQNQGQQSAPPGAAQQNSTSQGADSHMDLPPPPPSTHEKKKKGGLFKK